MELFIRRGKTFNICLCFKKICLLTTYQNLYPFLTVLLIQDMRQCFRFDSLYVHGKCHSLLIIMSFSLENCLCGFVQMNTIQYNTVQYNTVHYNTIQYLFIRQTRCLLCIICYTNLFQLCWVNDIILTFTLTLTCAPCKWNEMAKTKILSDNKKRW